MTSITIFRQSATAAKPSGEMRATFWGDFKDFFAKQRRFGRSPFAEMPTSWM